MSTPEKQEIRKKITGYIVGFALSLACTFIAYWIVWMHVSNGHLTFTHTIMITMLAILAISQFIIQLVYFLHLGTESQSRWKLLVFWFMIIIVLIIVVGSLWIMQNLNYNMMRSPEQSQQYIQDSQGGF